MTRARFYRWMLIAIGLIVLAISLGVVRIDIRKPLLYASASASGEAGHWQAAFQGFYAVMKIDPHYRDVDYQTEVAADKMIEMPPGSIAADVEVELIRWLSECGERAKLAELLDQSMILIPQGEFIMGSNSGDDDEHPEFLVYLDPFKIDKYEVTNAQYFQYLSAAGGRVPRHWGDSMFPIGSSDHPVIDVGWKDANAYCEWVGKRLPTEAEWERACRGEDGRLYPWGNAWRPDQANLGLIRHGSWPVTLDDAWSMFLRDLGFANGLGIMPIGSFPQGASSYGVMDMVGNVSEWVADRYNWDGYSAHPVRNPLIQEPRWNHSLRGTPWFDWRGLEDTVQWQSRCSARNSSHSAGDMRIGFRCAKSMP